jgi:hypothetical protein
MVSFKSLPSCDTLASMHLRAIFPTVATSRKKELMKIVHFIWNSAADLTFDKSATPKTTEVHEFNTDCGRATGMGDGAFGTTGDGTVTGWVSSTRGSTLCAVL